MAEQTQSSSSSRVTERAAVDVENDLNGPHGAAVDTPRARDVVPDSVDSILPQELPGYH